jgi:MFS family permease
MRGKLWELWMPPTSSGLRIVLLLCVAEVLAMTGFATYPALLPTLRQAWGMSGAEAGLVGGAFFFGYMVSVPLLSGLTDRVDAKRVFAASCVLAAAGALGFGRLAEGVWSGVLWQAVSGAGLAGTYMPGLKALTDRVHGPKQSRYVSFYTATFGVGASGSLLLAGWLAAVHGWAFTFQALAVFPLLAAPLVLWVLEPKPPLASGAPWFPRFGGVWADRRSRLYIVGYAVHCWELFGLRSWQVAFFTFAFGVGATQAWLSPTEAAAVLNLLGLPASILGNEMALRWGRRRWIAAMMLSAGVMSWVAGLSAAMPWFLTLAATALYNVMVTADSASLTAGLVANSDPARRGAAMALYSLGGFGAGFVAPVVFGSVLDLTGGHQSVLAWTVSMGVLGAGGLVMGWRLRRTTGVS